MPALRTPHQHRPRRLYEVLETSTLLCLVTERVDVDLMTVIERDGGLPEQQARHLTRQLVSAVQYLHSKSVVHRDMKPDNLMLDAAGNLKLIDFGLSNTLMDPTDVLMTQCGSISYSVRSRTLPPTRAHAHGWRPAGPGDAVQQAVRR